MATQGSCHWLLLPSSHRSVFLVSFWCPLTSGSPDSQHPSVHLDLERHRGHQDRHSSIVRETQPATGHTLTARSISITGLVVLGGGTSIQNPTANFQNAFEGTSSDGYALSNALVNITFAYTGYENAFNVLAEVKNPIKTVKRAAPIALGVVATLYIMCNVAYFAASKSMIHHHALNRY